MVQHFKRFLRKTNFSSSSIRLFNSNYTRKNAFTENHGKSDRSNPRTLLDIFKFRLTRSSAKLIEFRRNSLRDPEAQRNSSHAYTRRFQKPRNVVVTIANSRCCHLWGGEGGHRYALPPSTVFVYERGRSWIMVTIDVVYTRATFERSYRLRADLIPRSPTEQRIRAAVLRCTRFDRRGANEIVFLSLERGYHITVFLAVEIIFCSFSVEWSSDNAFNSSFSTFLLKDEAMQWSFTSDKIKKDLCCGEVLRNSLALSSYCTSLTSICVEQKLYFSSFDAHTRRLYLLSHCTT